ncbi:MAG TPA: hypothetical protein VFZ45_01010, partial [Actinomycetota bacterium]|nr:hypothetical protein [Actinomycetota bacterium]
MIGWSRLSGVVAGRIEAAGGSPADVDRVLGHKVWCAFLGAGIWLLASPSGPAGLLLGPFLISGGFLVPDLVLARRTAVLRARAEASVADLLDLVAVSVSAGLTPRLAMERAPEALGG